MQTLGLKKAAAMVNLHPQTLRQMAIEGKAPGAKPGKKWVFIVSDLADWLRGQYVSGTEQTQQPQQCRSSSDQIPASTGADSLPQTGDEYENLLRLPTAAKRRNSRTG